MTSNYSFSFLFSLQVVIRSVPVGIGDDGPTTVRRGGSFRNDGVSSRWLSTGPTEAMPGRIFRCNGRLLVRPFQRPADHASTSRLSARLSRCPGRLRLKYLYSNVSRCSLKQRSILEWYVRITSRNLSVNVPRESSERKKEDSTWAGIKTKTHRERDSR